MVFVYQGPFSELLGRGPAFAVLWGGSVAASEQCNGSSWCAPSLPGISISTHPSSSFQQLMDREAGKYVLLLWPEAGSGWDQKPLEAGKWGR